MRLAFCLALFGTGCLSDALVPCGELACPIGLVCTPGGCATQDSAAVCEGQLDGAACTSSVVSGVCRGGSCHEDACGNGVLELDEVCDDGNLVAGDGCSPLCDSVEVCGNAIVDVVTEECDEGVVGLSHDGCSSRCSIETDAWTDVSPAPVSPRFQHAVAYDSSRNRIVLFGGASAQGVTGDTWEWNGSTWQRRPSVTLPSPRSGAAMAYDRTRGHVIMFGGGTATGVDAETWTWDGLDWKRRLPGTSPPARINASMSFDASRERIVLQGGLDSSAAPLHDTWEWDGSVWIDRTPATSPGNVIADPMVYDPSRNGIVLFASRPGGGQPSRTMLWNGTSWAQIMTAASPANVLAAMTYDTNRGVIVLFGGVDGAGAPSGETWELDAADTLPAPNWQLRQTTPARARFNTTLTYDESRAQLVMFGGRDASDALGDTWVWNTAAWVSPGATPPLAPSPRHGHAMAFDASRGQTILFGGQANGVVLGGTWNWTGLVWIPLLVPNPPAPRFEHDLVYDFARGRILMFGGGLQVGTQFVPTNELWELVGQTWTERTPAFSPSPRIAASAVYDSLRDRVVVFGGTDAVTTVYGDTWELSAGTTWNNRSGGAAPSARVSAAMAFDVSRGRTVLFGGTTSLLGGLGDTWEWDGSVWTEMPVSGAPAPRYGATMTYDPVRRRVVLVGGLGAGGVGLGDAWEWDGATWTPRAEAPGVRRATSMVYDPVRRGMLMFGGDTALGPLGDTWMLRFADGAPQERCLFANADDDGDGLMGCADPDCWGRCTPWCAPGTSCGPGPRCGDGACMPVEDALICPADC